MNAILECKNICKRYGGIQALQDVSIQLQPGECHALIGENGAGKSTLIKIISGIESKDSGAVFYANKLIEENSPRIAQELGISTVYQEPIIFNDLSVVENIFLGREIRDKFGNIDWKKQKSQTIKLLESLDISPNFVSEPIGSLSVGLQQLSLIAKALAFDCKIIIFDEPTSSLTEHEAERLFKIISKLKNINVGIIYISHRLEELFEIADRVTIMRDGTIVGTYQIEDLNRNRMVELMAGKLLSQEIIKHVEVGSDKVLEVKNLTKKGKFNDISFDLFPGEILGFFGLVGSGRSEVFQSIFGITRPDSGNVLLKKKKIKLSSPSSSIKNGIVYFPEDRKIQGLFLSLSSMYNVAITILNKISELFGVINTNKEKKTFEEYISKLRIRIAKLNTPACNLSGGNQQKLVLAKWLAVNPDILILDEPTRGIDVGAKVEIHNIIKKLAIEKKAIVVISSEIPEIVKLSSRVIVLCEGRIIGTFVNDEINSMNLLHAATGKIFECV